MKAHLRPLILGALLTLLGIGLWIPAASAHADTPQRSQNAQTCTPTIRLDTATLFGVVPTITTVSLDPCTLAALIQPNVKTAVMIQSNKATPDDTPPIMKSFAIHDAKELWSASLACTHHNGVYVMLTPQNSLICLVTSTTYMSAFCQQFIVAKHSQVRSDTVAQSEPYRKIDQIRGNAPQR